jgi:hypothetical protein
MSDLEKLRKTQIDKVNNLIIPATIHYPEKVKGFKNNLDKISEIKKQKEKHQNEISRAQTKKEFDKVGQISAEYKKREDEENIEGNKVEVGLADFEAERVIDNKYLLLHYIHSEIAFHSTALEKLTKLYAEIICHDPKELIPEFVNHYNLNSVKETNLANKYGFTPGETARKLERLKNPTTNTTNVNKGMVNMVGVNPNTGSLSPGVRPSVVNRLSDDPILNENRSGSLSPAMRSSGLNQGFNTNTNTKSQMTMLNQK